MAVDPGAPTKFDDAAVEQALDEIPLVIAETKKGYKTTEFWLTVVGALVIGLGAVPTPHDAKGYALAALVGLYAVARGLSKSGVPTVDTE